MPAILVADDDEHIRELVRIFLQREGFRVFEAENGKKALELLESEKIDLAVLDVMMPEMDGWQLCEEIRRFGDFPVLMLTAKGETAHKIRGFDLGADDYMVKPFEPAELVARTKALLKRYRIAVSQTAAVGAIVLDRQTCEVAVGGQRVAIPLKEFEVLFKLAVHAGRTVPRERLIEDIWGIDFEGNERTLDVHINRLRDRLAEWDPSVKIRTVRGLGYRLEAGQ
ncbi:response regulator transcription factor [Paenibacillus cisolokensis]|uniref:response regulator transcription factor n=1 Tax=Paenibacillus TaxID=44249 RepID=UPI0007221DE8|nr:response regulator transcription factor [Paenibacillus sp. 32O-W]ALS26743.1 two-component system response regulator [Paenibacillus sp. 32O-W]